MFKCFHCEYNYQLFTLAFATKTLEFMCVRWLIVNFITPFDTLPELNSCWTGLTQETCKMAWWLKTIHWYFKHVFTSLFYINNQVGNDYLGTQTHGLSSSHPPLIIVSMKKVKSSRTLLWCPIEYIHFTFAIRHITIPTLGLNKNMFSRHQIPKWEAEKYQDRHHPRWQHGGDLLIELRNWMKCVWCRFWNNGN